MTDKDVEEFYRELEKLESQVEELKKLEATLKITPSLWAVIGTWDLTPLEKAVMKGRL